MNRFTLCAALATAFTSCADGEPDRAVDEDFAPAGAATPPAYDLAPAIDSPTQPSPALTGAEKSWAYSRVTQTATFKPRGDEGAISLRCEKNTLANPKLVFLWNIVSPQNQNQTVSMHWGGDAETFAIEPAGGTPDGNVSSWRAILDPTGEEANFLLIAPSPITFTFGALGEPKVMAPASDSIKHLIQSCQ